ncbi:restriction endonuclease subunit S [Flavobacterium nitratireducens]|uniref:restriction endonuclease subunit S n=1 Tax=Flavobacterium nitratireducens TaxID=992289 RepID=UPI00241535A5|nr:restriction endonuclease subunit S [Flavobacterium nitratireducens]
MELMEKQGFKQTEVGLIPDDWNVKKLEEVLQFGSGQDYKHLSRGEIPVYGTGGLMTFVNNYLYNGDSVGIGRKGTIDKPVFLSGKFWTVDTLFYTHSFVNSFPKFIYYKFLMIPWKEFNEASGVPSLNKNTLGKINISIPQTLEEQKAIATALSDVDTLIANLEKLITKKKAIKQGAMQQLLTPPHKGGKRLEGYTGDWVEKKMGECLKYEQPTKYIVKNANYEGQSQTPVLTAGKTFLLGFTDEKEGIYSDLPVIIFDDFTTSKQYVDFEFKVKSSAMKMLKATSETDINFIYSTMNMINFSLGDDHKRRWIAEYSKITIFVPEIQEQKAISEILSDMDLEIEKLESKKAKCQNVKQGMMQELLTGKTRLV